MIKACLLTVPPTDPAVQNISEPPCSSQWRGLWACECVLMDDQWVYVRVAGRTPPPHGSRRPEIERRQRRGFRFPSFCKVCVWIHQVLVITLLLIFLCRFCCSVQIKVGQFVNNNNNNNKVCKVSILSSHLFESVRKAQIHLNNNFSARRFEFDFSVFFEDCAPNDWHLVSSCQRKGTMLNCRQSPRRLSSVTSALSCFPTCENQTQNSKTTTFSWAKLPNGECYFYKPLQFLHLNTTLIGSWGKKILTQQWKCFQLHNTTRQSSESRQTNVWTANLNVFFDCSLSDGCYEW